MTYSAGGDICLCSLVQIEAGVEGKGLICAVDAYS
jgi:hypothetical protein